jgi:hypothetical protein
MMPAQDGPGTDKSLAWPARQLLLLLLAYVQQLLAALDCTTCCLHGWVTECLEDTATSDECAATAAAVC